MYLIYLFFFLSKNSSAPEFDSMPLCFLTFEPPPSDERCTRYQYPNGRECPILEKDCIQCCTNDFCKNQGLCIDTRPFVILLLTIMLCVVGSLGAMTYIYFRQQNLSRFESSLEKFTNDSQDNKDWKFLKMHEEFLTLDEFSSFSIRYTKDWLEFQTTSSALW